MVGWFALGLVLFSLYKIVGYLIDRYVPTGYEDADGFHYGYPGKDNK